MSDRLLTVKEVAVILGVNPNFVYNLINHKLLRAMKLGSKKVRQATLDKFLESYDGMDFTDLNNIKEFDPKSDLCECETSN